MTNAAYALLMTMALLAVAPIPSARAQMDFSADEADSDGGGMDFSADEADSEAPVEDEGGEGESEGGGSFDDLLNSLDEGGEEETWEAGERPTETSEEIYAVQQIYALRLHRVELAPSAAFTINDPYLSHVGAGLALNYWWTNVLAIGANFVWYQFSDELNESDIAFHTRRSTNLGIPLTEWQNSAAVNLTYVPFYGKFSAFRRLIFQWDSYLVGGVGVMRTRPFPVFDPEIRSFPDFSTHLSINLGLGVRIFLSRWLTLFVEFRDYLFFEQFENDEVGLLDDRENEGTWAASDSTPFHNLSAQVGFTVFLPTTFEYRRPK